MRKKFAFYVDFSKGRETMSPALRWASIVIAAVLMFWTGEPTLNLIDEIFRVRYLASVEPIGYLAFYFGAVIVLFIGIGIFRICINDIPVGRGARMQNSWNMYTEKWAAPEYWRDNYESSLASFDEETWDVLRQNEPRDYEMSQRALKHWKIIRIFSVTVGGLIIWLSFLAAGLVNKYWFY